MLTKQLINISPIVTNSHITACHISVALCTLTQSPNPCQPTPKTSPFPSQFTFMAPQVLTIICCTCVTKHHVPSLPLQGLLCSSLPFVFLHSLEVQLPVDHLKNSSVLWEACVLVQQASINCQSGPFGPFVFVCFFF